jgi:hypothetical protein
MNNNTVFMIYTCNNNINHILLFCFKLYLSLFYELNSKKR